MFNEFLEKFDRFVIFHIKRIFPLAARLAIFVIFFWFGALKVFEASPAGPLVENLLKSTLPFVSFREFIVFFGFYEIVIGLAFLIPKLERFAIALLLPHLVTTILPLIFLPEIAWEGFFRPTLEGQYIIKNLLIVALALGIAANLHPLKLTEKRNG